MRLEEVWNNGTTEMKSMFQLKVLIRKGWIFIFDLSGHELKDPRWVRIPGTILIAW